MPITKIVVGVDHSDRSDKALLRANAIALEHGAHLIIDHALDVGGSERLRRIVEDVAAGDVRERAANLLGDRCAGFEAKASVGRPHEVLRDLCLDCSADLVVLGVHRTDKATSLFSGSTARRLINFAPAPVLVVRSASADAYRRVLVGYDDSPPAREALRFARALAPAAKFTVVTACMIPFSARREQSSLVRQFETDTRRMVLEALGRSGETDDIDVIVRVGEAFGVIMDVQQEMQPDLLVLGTSMPAAFRQIFGGGIVDLVAADPPCDLLVVKT
jgi:nucleotide-binding universal stress UspA family protein